MRRCGRWAEAPVSLRSPSSPSRCSLASRHGRDVRYSYCRGSLSRACIASLRWLRHLLVVLHLGLLFFDPFAQLRLIDFIVPFLGAYRPLWLGLGTLTFDVLVVVVVTSLLRHRLGGRAFRAVHWASYALWPGAMAHAIGNGTDAGHEWFLLFAAFSALTVCGALAWRLHANFAEYAGTRTSGRT